MDRLLYNELFVRLLAIALAVLIYVQVVSQPTGIMQRAIPGVPVQAAGVPADLALRSITPRTVVVTVQGQAQLIQGLEASGLQAVVDLGSAKPGSHAYGVEVTVPQGVQLVSVSPSVVTVTSEPVVDQPVAVDVEVVGKPARGYAVGAGTAAPATVIVHGPASAVRSVARAVVRVDLAGATSSWHGEAVPVPVDAEGRPVEGVQAMPASVAVTVPVARVLASKRVGVSVVLLGQPARGYAEGRPVVSPDTVTVVGPAPVLSRVRAVDTAPVAVAGARGPVSAEVLVEVPPGAVEVLPRTVAVRVPVAAARAGA